MTCLKVSITLYKLLNELTVATWKCIICMHLNLFWEFQTSPIRFCLLINYRTHFVRFGQTWSNYSYLKHLLNNKKKPLLKSPTTNKKHLSYNLYLSLIIWKCSHWRYGEISLDFGRIIWPKLLWTDWKASNEKRGNHKSKSKICVQSKMTQKYLIKTDCSYFSCCMSSEM